MPKALKNCPAGHKMTTDNTYWQNKHGNAYPVCRECKQIQAKERKKYSFTKADQKRISQMEVVTEDITGITNCPKCEGILKWGEDSRLDDKVACVYCGWRPSAKVVMEL
jgi:hypothetical protein|tara:strand:+ start:285 stop:611 length:327 start_codon:yes stop_codon:yes gene_type:complete